METTEKTRGKKISFILFTLLGVIVLGFLGYRYVAPFGKIVYYRFTSKLPEAEEVTTFSPGENSVLKIPHQVIKTSQSKLSLKLLSKEIESVKASLKFKKGPREIKLGIRGNEKDNFSYQPLYHLLLQDLNWEKIEEGGFILWEKEKKYQTLYNFVNNPPPDKKTAAYFVDQDKLLLLKPAEIKKEAKTTIKTSLRGNHVFLIRVDKEPLVLKVAKQDSNAYQGEDKLRITVMKGSSTLIEKVIEDDGITDKSQLKGEPQEETITLKGVGQGVYQVNLTSESEGADSLITKIEVNQSKVTLKNQIFILGDESTVLWTNAKKISISTFHEPSFQTVRLDDKYDLKIKEVAKPHPFDLESLAGKKESSELYKLESPKNDLIIQGGGYFAFSEDSFFYPEVLKSVDLNSLSDLEDVDYVLTTCPQAKQSSSAEASKDKEGDWLVAETYFDPQNIKIEDNKLYFSLEVPELAKYGGELEIDYLEIAVKSKGVLEKDSSTVSTPSPQAGSEQEGPSEEALSEAEKGGQKQNLLQKTKQATANIFDQIGKFFANIILRIFRRQTRIPTEEAKPSPTPTLIPSPSPTPTPTPEITEKVNTPVKVLNGGAGAGKAGEFAKKLAEKGFTNVLAANADKLDYKNALIRYRKENEKEADKIVGLLQTDYPTIERNEIATTSAEIVVIIGKK